MGGAVWVRGKGVAAGFGDMKVAAGRWMVALSGSGEML